MQKRIERYRAEIARLHQLALAGDPKGAVEWLSLAREIELTIAEMEQPSPPAEDRWRT